MNCGGIRITNSKDKVKIDNHPLVTIITVSYNSASTLEKTILNIIGQDYDNLEYIIVDGNSNDGTREILNKYNDKIDFWVSEPDKGLYDAMNKGIELAKGEWVNFMNSNDQFYAFNSISSFFCKDSSTSADVIYGDFVAYDEDNLIEILVKAKDIKMLWREMCFSHQACFIRAELAKKYKFDLSYLIVADYFMLLNLYKDGYIFLYLPGIVATTTINGLSYSNPKTKIEIRRASTSLNNSIYVCWYQFIAVNKALIHGRIIGLVGPKITSLIRSAKWRYKNIFLRSK